MVEPGNVFLTAVKDLDGDHLWLTDQIVMLDVTGFAVAREEPEGWYRIVGGAKPGLRSTLGEDAGAIGRNIEAWLKVVRSRVFFPAVPTYWSFPVEPDDWADTKAFLVYTETPLGRLPLAMNETVWRNFRVAYPDATLTHSGTEGPFKVSTPGVPELAYIEPFRIPEHLQPGAIKLMEEYVNPDTNLSGAHKEDANR